MLTGYSIKKPWSIVVIMVIIVLLGVISYINTPVDLLPNVNMPYVAVATVMMGASPEAIETKITKPTESALMTVGGVRSVTSMSMEHFSIIIMEFESDVDVDNVVVDIRESLNMLKSADKVQGAASMATEGISVGGGGSITDTMADMRTDPMILKLNPSMMPVMMLSMGYKNMKAIESSAAMKNLVSKIEGVEGVASVNAQGLVKDLVIMQLSGDNLLSSVLPNLPPTLVDAVPKNTLDALINGVSQIISPSLLSTLLFAQNIDMPVGMTTEDGLSYFVKVKGDEYKSAEDLKKVPIVSLNLKEFVNAVRMSPDYNNDKISSEILVGFLTNLAGGNSGVENASLDMINTIANMQVPEELASILKVEDVDKVVPDGKYVKKQLDGGKFRYEIYDADKATHVGQDRFNAPNIKFNELLPGTTLLDILFRENGVIDDNLKADDYSVSLTLGSITNMFELDTSGSVMTSLNGENTVSLTIMKQTNAATTAVSRDVLKVLEKEKAKNPDFFFVSMFDQGFYINQIVTSALLNMVTGGLLAILILFIFLKRIKPTVVVGISIIISVVLTFVLMYFSGITLNVISMGGLALGVGMLVDNSIIVIENIYRQKQLGKDPKQAAIDGTKQILGAIISSTITTVIVFVPIFFVQGIVKEIFKDMALTIAYSLLASLLFSITLVPTAAATILKNDKEKPDRIFEKIRNGYKKSLRFVLNKRWLALLIVVILLTGSVVVGVFMPRELFPMQSAGLINATIEIDTEKIPAEKTLDQVMFETMDYCNEKLLPDGKPLDYISYVNISQTTDMISSLAGFTASGGKSLTVNILKNTKSKLSDVEVRDKVTQLLKNDDVYSLEVAVQEDMANMGALMGEGVSVNFYCDSLEDLQTAVLKATSLMRGIDGVAEASSVLDNVQPEYRLVVDREKANKYGLTVAQVMLGVNQALVGKGKTTSIQFKGDNEPTALSFYPGSYDIVEWIKTRDKDGNYIKVFVQNDEKRYVVNNSGADIEYLNGTKPVTAHNGDRIYVTETPVANSDALKYAYTLADNTTVEFVTDKVAKYFYSATPKEKFDFMTCKISNDMSSMGMNMDVSALVGVKEVELWKVLDDSCFIRDANGKIVWVDANGNVVAEGTDGAKPQGIVKTPGYFSINHLNGKRMITVNGAVKEGYNLDAISKDIRRVLDDSDIAFEQNGVSYEFQGQLMLIQETFKIVYTVLALGIVLIYLVMVAQFQSLKSPFIVMFTIPLALSGCLYALGISGMALSATALIGAVVLVGIIVNNGIVFVDYANQLVDAGHSVKDALLQTGYDRLRPIMMTALTTIIAMATMAMDNTPAGAMIRPMAIAAMGGLFYATLLTLFVVPVMYSLFNSHRDSRRFAKNPPKAYPSDFTEEDIAAYESRRADKNEQTGEGENERPSEGEETVLTDMVSDGK